MKRVKFQNALHLIDVVTCRLQQDSNMIRSDRVGAALRTHKSSRALIILLRSRDKRLCEAFLFH